MVVSFSLPMFVECLKIREEELLYPFQSRWTLRHEHALAVTPLMSHLRYTTQVQSQYLYQKILNVSALTTSSEFVPLHSWQCHFRLPNWFDALGTCHRMCVKLRQRLHFKRLNWQYRVSPNSYLLCYCSTYCCQMIWPPWKSPRGLFFEFASLTVSSASPCCACNGGSYSAR